ncbi:hypothetical protein FHS43_000003 [Streptosporangium becharense]|uniref:Uncharacterized protein n=1 Tax=Streptosporangium becharense TaxID=1816182 RepID=A0A7W9MGU3_9ACTN|nr:hypothetical protein [Streptosporangium becharense]MBB2908757.1 hypothetical protein [Streptosporangium becharense]MBB5820225.1 hypothetical protein [Streptosporangium becharense]
MSTESAQRLETRAKKLKANAKIYAHARNSCKNLYYRSRRHIWEVHIRRAFILARYEPFRLSLDKSDSIEEFSPSWDRSPLTSLISSRGIAIQLFLICLFEAQSRCQPGVEPKNNRPLQPKTDEVAWLDLLATHASAKAPATPRDNRLRQIKKALLHLERELLVEIPGGKHTNDRFQGFRLLNESGMPTQSNSLVRYSVPLDQEDTLKLPIDFFLMGWVHVLSPAEIATYLMLLDLKEQHKEAHDSHGIFSPSHIRVERYTLSRDSYESHQSLAKYGLIKKVPNANRYDNGKVSSFRSPLQSHHFKISKGALSRDAFKITSGISQQAIPGEE